jgi:hypothetical protein
MVTPFTLLLLLVDYPNLVILSTIRANEKKTQNSQSLLAPHTNGPRDVPRCGALSLLQKTRATGGVQQKPFWAKLKFLGSDCVTVWCSPPFWNS